VFAIAFTCLSLAVALACAIWARRAWRDPDNWHIDPDSKRLAFDRWAEFALAGVLCLASCVGLVAGFQF
jgi:hypothetical protein